MTGSLLAQESRPEKFKEHALKMLRREEETGEKGSGGGR